MSLRGNQFRRANTFRNVPLEQDDNEEIHIKPKSRVKPNNTKSADTTEGKFDSSRLVKVLGLFMLLLSVYFLVAFTSYLFTWQEDQSYVIDANGGWSNLFKTPAELAQMNLNQGGVVENWLGKLGALLSHQFIYEWFGVASFLFIGIFFIIGYRLLFKVKLVSIGKSLAYSFFLLVFTSVAIAFVHGFVSDYPHYLEGEFGFWANRLLMAQIGNAGTFGLLAFTGLTALTIAYNIDFRLPEREPKYVVPDAGTDELVEEVVSEPVEFPLNDRFQDQLAEEDARMLEEEEETEELPEPEIIPSASGPEMTIEKTEEEVKADQLVQEFGAFDPKLDLSQYVYPHLELLENYGSNKISVNAEELEANKNKIVETLNHYNIEIDKIKATIGPTVTLYEIIPAPGVRISKIKNLEDDIALSLAALGIRIIAPMPGKGTIGIEVPNQNPEMVSMRSVLGTEKFQNTTMELPIALGKTISNEVYIADLAKMPHLLVAGATGQGKSVGINCILASLLYKLHPSQLKFVLVDPKKVELTLFRKIERHFLAKLPGEEDAIITDTKKVINTLNSLCIEMDQRYDLLKNAQVRNLKEYNQKFTSRKLNPEEGHRFLPFIVLIVDEFADLMMTAGKEVETPIARLAQLARAVGIHLVIATQRPSVNIITGTIKANFPARLAFRVLSKIDSRTILDSGGADQLIGRGDMLLSTGNDMIRLQCAFVDTPEVERISDFIGSQRGYDSAWMLPEYIDEAGEGSSRDFDPNDRDPLFEEAARLVVMHQQGSTSLIQRKLKLGYNRAGRIIDQLEGAGIVGPFEGSKAREVLFPDEYSLEQFLNGLADKNV